MPRVVLPCANPSTYWTLILAITLYPLNQRLGGWLGNRPGWSAVLWVMVGLACLIGP
ncbi:hypothetical protein [Pseudomonas putida]|uniref:hypothetical protein n=1 Tax=Pseudomonas putida TaxID=303 RepID=UPI00236728DA|nr:hypothetical protein [Pseudomonas putida]MDD2046674.1 hypothetical protein [Pseudomonas putida]